MIAGYVMSKQGWITALRSAEVIAWTTIGFGVLLYVIDRACMTVKTTEHAGIRDALFIGLAQVLALVPGTSRSGITMTAARLLGYERTESARFSMLMSIPTILAAGALAGLELYETGDVAIQGDAIVAAALSFICALFAIALLMRWLRFASYTPFVIYRLLLGGFLLWWVYFMG
jgi:undecaprenyl-diphosphatase